MEQRTENNLVEEEGMKEERTTMKDVRDYFERLFQKEEPEKSEKGNNKRKLRGSYKKHKLDKKITVKHFLNERVNLNKVSKKESEYMDSAPLHPIYVQIIFMGKNTTIRSAIDEMCSSQESFNEYISDYYLKGLFEREKRFIEYYIKSYYDEFIEYEKESFNKNLDEDEIEHYVSKNIGLKRIMLGFDYYEHEIIVKIDKALKAELLNFARELSLSYPEPLEEGISKDDEQDTIYERMFAFKFINIALEFPEKKISAIQLLNYYEERIPAFKEMRDRFSSQIWNFNIYYSDFVDNCENSYRELGATIADFLQGDFKQSFLEYYIEEPEIAQNIIKDIESFDKNGALKNLIY